MRTVLCDDCDRAAAEGYFLMETAWQILKSLETSFTEEDGADFFQYVYFYERNPKPWSCVRLDGEFTPSQLRKIADAMDEAKQTYDSTDHT